MSARDNFSFIDEWVLRKIYRSLGRPPFRLLTRSGVEVSSAEASPLGQILISDRATLARLLLDPEVGFGDAYMEGRIEVQGDLVSMLEAMHLLMPDAEHQNWFAKLASRWMQYIQANSLLGSRKNIHEHYDLSNDFYRLWLDPLMVYTCAYFSSPSATLEEAQTAKMELVCRKLQLQPGETVAEAGCGWGALALHMAQHYGVNVRAFNISGQQIAWARQRARELGLGHRVEFIEDDYRNISGQFDVFVSVGMLEHVGKEHYRELGGVIHRSLYKSGRGFLHFIGRNQPHPMSPWLRKRIFPGSYAPTLGEAMEVLEPWDFSVLDVENLRPHYARTLEHWLERFEKSADKISGMFGPAFVRAWRLYLASATAGFLVGALQLFQVVFARNACQHIPPTRAHLYPGQRHEKTESKWNHATS
jgi:cyclopropane-fatty-acyl-phospholipid synthase